MATAKFMLADLGNQGGVGLRAFYISGPPGVGKTHSIRDQEARWQERGMAPMRFRPSNVHELLDHFENASGRRPLIMEEADIIFRSKPMFEILKQATDPDTPDMFTRIRKVKGRKVAVQVNLNVPIVVSTNMNLLSDVGWDKSLLNDRDALFNRSMSIVIPDDPHELWEWSVYLALTSHLTRDVSLRNPNGGKPILHSNSLQVQAAALDWFSDHLPNLAVVAPRTLKQVAQTFGRVSRKDMPQDIAEEMLSRLLTERRDISLPQKHDWAKLLTSMPKDVERRVAA
jgi:hypothetical protein